jgi:hypothetical protein
MDRNGDNFSAEDFAAMEIIASRVVEKLQTNVIPASLPKHIGDFLRESLEYGSVYQAFVVNLPKSWITVHLRFNPDGSINMDLCDINNARFWTGTFISES